MAQTEEQDQQGMQVLTRGPVHEAFAETISYDPKPGIIIDKAPPTAIEEVPPDQQPVGNNVSWIPGYWAWDDDQGDFLWISGIWRNLPPDREWVPGYWSPVGNQYQWTSGYWADSGTDEVTYLPEPPATLEEGPSVAAVSSNESWVPGNWRWNEERYAWSPGYWQEPRTDWVWIPSRYVWTHRGYVYVDGYWDYSVSRRGVLFAPVHFAPDYYSRPNFSYSPITVISLAIFTNHLFVRPNYGHYYFGDYYEPRYRDRGYYAPFAFNSGRRGYDPIFAYDRWRNRGDRGWENRVRQDFDFRRDNENARPPHTWAALRNLPRDNKDPRRNFAFAEPFSQYTKDRKGGPGFRKVGEDDRQKLIAQRQQIQRFSQERQKLEFVNRGPDRKDDGPRKDVERLKIDRSPLVGRSAAQFGKGEGPPQRPVVRKIDPKAGPGGPNAIPGREGRDGRNGQDGRPGPDGDRGDNRGPKGPDGVIPGGDRTRPDRVPQDGVKPDRDGPNRGENGKPGDTTRPDRMPQDGVKPDRDGPKRGENVKPGDTTRPDRVPQDGVKPDREAPKRGDNVVPGGDRTRPDRVPQDGVKPDRKPDPKVAPDRSRNPDRAEPSKGEVTPPRRVEPQPTPPKVAPEKRERPERPNVPETARKVERPEPKVQPQPQPRPQPRPEPRAQPQPQPQPKVQPQPRVQPQPQRVQPQPQPRPQPQPQQQQARPTPQPRPQPAAQPGGGGGGGRSKEKDKD